MIKVAIRIALVAALVAGGLSVTPNLHAEKRSEAKANRKKPEAFRGNVAAVDLKAGTLTVKTKKESRTFLVNADTDLAELGADTKFADLKVGETINVEYKLDTTPLVATKIAPVAKNKGKSR